MIKPKPVELNCKRCQERFISESKSDYEYNEHGDNKKVGYYFSKVCNKCREHENTLARDSKEYGQILYDEGLITLKEYQSNYANKRKEAK